MPVDFCRAGGGCCTQGTLPQLLCDLPLPTAGRTQRDSLARGAGDTGVPEACPDLHTALLNSRVTKPSAGRKPRASIYRAAQTEGLSDCRDCWGCPAFPASVCRTALMALNAWEQVSTGPHCSSQSSTKKQQLLSQKYVVSEEKLIFKSEYIYIWQKLTPR